MHRREFITLLGGAAAAWPGAAGAQRGEAIKRLGILRGGVEADSGTTNNTTLLVGLARLGWVEGRNLRVDYRQVARTGLDAIPPIAEALVRAVPDVIVASPATAVQVLQQLTRTIPVVFVQNADPVQAGTVQSLARPGGNLAGFVGFEGTINTKNLQLLRDIAPHVTRVAVVQTEATWSRGDFALIEAVTPSFGVAPTSILFHDDAVDIERALVSFAPEPNGGLIFPPDGVTLKRRQLIAALAAKHRLPAIYYNRLTEAGGLMSHSPAPVDYRQVATYVDRILRGSKPADLPVQTPTKFELVIKLKTATDLGLTIPPSMFALTDEVIE